MPQIGVVEHPRSLVLLERDAWWTQLTDEVIVWSTGVGLGEEERG